MHFKLILFTFCYFYFIIVGLAEKTTNLGITSRIRNYLLFINDSVEMSLFIPISNRSQPPLVIISIMLIKTLDCEIPLSIVHPIPYLQQNGPVLDLNAVANGNKSIFASALISAYKLDFTIEALVPITSSFMVPLDPEKKNLVKDDDKMTNETDPTIKITCSNEGPMRVLSSLLVASAEIEMEGLYKFFKHSKETLSGTVHGVQSLENVSQKFYFIQIVAYVTITSAVIELCEANVYVSRIFALYVLQTNIYMLCERNIGYDCFLISLGCTSLDVLSDIKEIWTEKHCTTFYYIDKNVLLTVEYYIKVEGVLKEDRIAVTIGGDHSVGIGSIEGHLRHNKDIAVVWVDAHADINTNPTSFTSFTGNIHGMTVAVLAKEL